MNKKPKTFSEEFCLENPSFIEKLVRDIRLLKFLGMTFYKWVQARHVRAEFQQSRERGEPFYVDRFTPPGSK